MLTIKTARWLKQISFSTVAILCTGLLVILMSPLPSLAQNHHMASNKPEKMSGAPAAEQTILGDVIPFGDGTARSWVKKDASGAYTSIGITLTEDALKGLPADVTPGLIWMVEYVLKLPEDAKDLPFNHIAVNWNPKGHVPAGIYNVPHFDFHFYNISREDRNKITARGKDLENCRKAPDKSYVPDGYIFAPESEEPGMGGHWVDPGAHEFHGKDFTSTFIFGSYDGNVIFWEPMITKAYIESKPNVNIPIKQPARYGKPGYYPASYSILYDDARKEYTISYDGMTLRQ